MTNYFPVDAMRARNSWMRWRSILDRIVSHPDYTYESGKKYPLIKLAQFAQVEMGHFNNMYWRLIEEAGPEARAIAQKETRRDNELRALHQCALLARCKRKTFVKRFET